MGRAVAAASRTPMFSWRFSGRGGEFGLPLPFSKSHVRELPCQHQSRSQLSLLSLWQVCPDSCADDSQSGNYRGKWGTWRARTPRFLARPVVGHKSGEEREMFPIPLLSSSLRPSPTSFSQPPPLRYLWSSGPQFLLPSGKRWEGRAPPLVAAAEACMRPRKPRRKGRGRPPPPVNRSRGPTWSPAGGLAPSPQMERSRS